MFILLFVYSIYCCVPECDKDSKCIPGVGCIPLEIENECVKRCGSFLYDICLNPSFVCDYTTQTLSDKHLCFEKPVCLENLCLRGGATECKSGQPCDASQGCPERNIITTPVKECLLKCGNTLYNSCLLPSLYCDENEQTVKDKNKCFRNPICYTTPECIRGQAIECKDNVPCDPSIGC